MRKLLVMLMVLGIASAAMAVPTISVSTATPVLGSTFTVTITGTAADATGDTTGDPVGGAAGALGLDYSNYSDGSLNPYISWVDVLGVTETAAGGLGGVSNATSNAAWTAAPAAGGWAEATDVDAGLWFTFTLNADALGTTEISLLNANFGQIGSIPIEVIVPEPMTMALLGLGGLFLRRRK